MRKKSVNYLVYSQLSFFGSMFICFALIPEAVTGNLGISFYGNYKKTLIPYTLGLFLTSYFIVKAANALQRAHAELKSISEFMFVIAILIIAVSLTPYSVDTIVDWAHILTSSVLFIVELLLALHITKLTRYRSDIQLLLGLQLMGALIAGASLLPDTEIMLTGQVITQLAFGILLIRGVDQLTTN